MSLSATFASPITTLSVARSEDKCLKQKKNVCFISAGLQPLYLHFQPFRSRETSRPAFRAKRTSIRAASLNATCAAEQTQTVTRRSSTITVAPFQGKEKSPELDDGGTGLGFPPCDDVGGGGRGSGGRGGGGGGGRWSGGFFLFAFLAFLGFLKDQESEEPYREVTRIRRDY